MFDNFFKKISLETQGILACILGLILILGTFGKLGILQEILNSIMILTGLALLFWGLHSSNAYHKIKDSFKNKKK